MSPAGRRQALLIAATAVGLTAAVYGPAAASAGYVHDDSPALLTNPLVRWPPPIGAIFTSPWLGPPERFTGQGVSRPLVTLGYCVEAGLGVGPAGRHGVNLALYAATAGLLGALLWSLLRAWPAPGRRTASLAGVALFACHPLHTSSVMNIGCRPEVQAAALALAATLAFVSAVRGRRWAGPGAVGLLLLALWSKESAVTVLAPWLVWGATRPEGRRRAWALVLAAAAVCGGWLLLRQGWLGLPATSFHDNPLTAASGAGRVLGALWLIAHAAVKLVWPYDLAPDETFDTLPVLAPDAARVALGATLLLGLCALAAWDLARAAGKKPGAGGLAASIAWVGGAWLPVSHLLFPSTVLFADRLLFLPSVGLLGLAAAWLGPALAGARGAPARVASLALLAGLALPWAAAARAEATHWRSDEALFVHGVRKRPRSLRMRYDLGRLRLQQGDLTAAAEQLLAARALDPRDLQSWILLLQVRTRQGDCDASEALIGEAPALGPLGDAGRKASVDADVLCGRFGRAFAAGRRLRRVDMAWALKVYVAGVGAGHAGAERWARRFAKRPRESPAWVAAAVHAEERAGRPEAALARLRHLHETRPGLPGPEATARRLCREARGGGELSPALDAACARWPGG